MIDGANKENPSLRLVLSIEGNWLCVYLAPEGMMEGAIKLAQTRLAMVHDETAKEAFLSFCRAGADVLWENSAPKKVSEP